MHTYKNKHIYTCIHTHMHAFIHEYIHTHKHSHQHVQIQIQNTSPKQKIGMCVYIPRRWIVAVVHNIGHRSGFGPASVYADVQPAHVGVRSRVRALKNKEQFCRSSLTCRKRGHKTCTDKNTQTLSKCLLRPNVSSAAASPLTTSVRCALVLNSEVQSRFCTAVVEVGRC